MTQWAERTLEERRLLNPAFCAQLLWRAARGHASVNDQPLALEESFLVLPFVLPAQVREALPRDTRTSLPIWLETEPLARGQVVTRARTLVPFTREALLFAGTRGMLTIQATKIYADARWAKIESRIMSSASDEVRECLKRAEFIGKWFALAGTAPTVLAFLGARP
mgnify:CR=1 FL=1